MMKGRPPPMDMILDDSAVAVTLCSGGNHVADMTVAPAMDTGPAMLTQI